MAASVIVDAGFLVSLLNGRDRNHHWAKAQTENFPLPWQSCEPALSETFHLLGPRNARLLVALLERGQVLSTFRLADHLDATLRLLHKYADTPISLADACLVRMTEVMPDPLLLTTDSDFRIYRRHGRQTIPCAMP